MLNDSSKTPAPSFAQRNTGLLALLQAAAIVGLSVAAAKTTMLPHLITSVAALLLLSTWVATCVVVLRRRQWDAWFSVMSVIVIFFGSQLVATLIVGIYANGQGWTSSYANDWVSKTTTGQFVFTAIVELSVLAGVYGYLRRFKIPLTAIGLRWARPSDVLYALAAVPAYYILFFITVGTVSHFVPGLNVNQQQDIGFTSVHGSVELVMTFISLAILPPITEEVLVRGLLYSSLKKAVRIGYAVVITSAIFASAHLPEGGAAGPLYIAALDTFVLSVVLIYLREKTDGLWASIFLHGIKNGIAFLALFVYHVH